MPRHGRSPTWPRHWLDRLINSLRLLPVVILAGALSLGAIACGSVDDGLEPTPRASGPYSVATDFLVVTPTSIEPPEGWWNPIDERELRLLDNKLTDIRMWGNCVWYKDDPSPSTEAAARKSLADVIGSPIAVEIGIVESANLSLICDRYFASVADFEIEVSDGRRAALASEMMIDLMDSCVSFYREPDPALGYRIAITFIDMLWMLEQDAPRWWRRDLWGVREWCDGVVEGAVAS